MCKDAVWVTRLIGDWLSKRLNSRSGHCQNFAGFLVTLSRGIVRIRRHLHLAFPERVAHRQRCMQVGSSVTVDGRTRTELENCTSRGTNSTFHAYLGHHREQDRFMSRAKTLCNDTAQNESVMGPSTNKAEFVKS